MNLAVCLGLMEQIPPNLYIKDIFAVTVGSCTYTICSPCAPPPACVSLSRGAFSDERQERVAPRLAVTASGSQDEQARVIKEREDGRIPSFALKTLFWKLDYPPPHTHTLKSETALT